MASNQGQDVVRCQLCSNPVEKHCNLCHVDLCSTCTLTHMVDLTTQHDVVDFIDKGRLNLNFHSVNLTQTKSVRPSVMIVTNQRANRVLKLNIRCMITHVCKTS